MPVSRKPPPTLEASDLEGDSNDHALPRNDSHENGMTIVQSTFSFENIVHNDDFVDPHIQGSSDHSTDSSTDTLDEVNTAMPHESFGDHSTGTGLRESFDQSVGEAFQEREPVPQDALFYPAHHPRSQTVSNFISTPLKFPPMPSMSSPDIVDSFHYDPEQYGRYTRLTYPAQPMSRSPTPSMHDHSMTSEKDLSGVLIHSVTNPPIDQEDPEKESIDEFLETKHFGPAPKGRMHRRRQTRKRIFLTEGNLVTDIDVPTNLVLPWKGEPEMQQTRYEKL